MDDTAIFTTVLKKFLDIIQNNYPIVHDMAKYDCQNGILPS